MNDKGKKSVLRPAGASRYGAFLSVGELVGIKAAGLKHAIKLEFLPQWGEERGHTEAALSKRSLLVDIRLSDITIDEVKGLAKLTERVGRAAQEETATLHAIIRAFGRSGSKEEREKALERAERLGLWRGGDSEPAALWAGIVLAGAAILIAGCCMETDTECEDGGNGTDTDPEK